MSPGKLERSVVKVVLMDISIYDTVTLEYLEGLKRPEFQSYVIESNPNDCGCYSSCHCPKERLSFKGVRPETDKEFKARVDKEDAARKTHAAKIEAIEREQLAKLKAKYDAKQ